MLGPTSRSLASLRMTFSSCHSEERSNEESACAGPGRDAYGLASEVPGLRYEWGPDRRITDRAPSAALANSRV